MMPGPVIIPIPIRIQHDERKCVLVDGRRYCESVEMSRSDGALLCLALAVFAAWIIAIGWALTCQIDGTPFMRRWGVHIAALLFFGPLLCGAAFLWLTS